MDCKMAVYAGQIKKYMLNEAALQVYVMNHFYIL